MTIQIKEYQPQDAAAVARLYQASDAGWPDGFVDNVLIPAEAIERDMVEENLLNTYLAWEDGKAVGFINLIQIPDDAKASYVGLLTSDPNYHGRGVGRDLLRRCIDRAVELGHTRITLGTRPGNTKAVPLYKKTGFHWGPDQTGWNELQNHIPLLLAHRLTKEYFATTDWYTCYRRDLSLGLDTQQRNGALVFPYRWEGPGGTLRAVFDQRTKKLVELDTPDLFLALDVEHPELIQGRERLATLLASSKKDQPLTVAVTAKDDGPVKAEHYEVLSVPAGGSGTAQFKLTTDPENTGYASAALSLLVDGHSVDMAATVRVVPALELELEPQMPALQSGRPFSATLNLRNRTQDVMDVRLLVQPTDGLTATLDPQTLTLVPGESAGVPIELQAISGGAYQLVLVPVVTAGGETKPHPPLKCDLVAVGYGEVRACRSQEETVLSTVGLSLAISHKEPEQTLRERRTGRSLLSQSFNVGPPYWPNPLDEEKAEVSIREAPGRVSATLRSNAKGIQGVLFERTITMFADNRVTAAARLTNLTGEQRRLAMRLELNLNDRVEDAAYLPLREGVVRGRGSMPGYRWAGPGSEPPLTARWVALERDGWTLGILWPEGLTPRLHADTWDRFSLRGLETALAPAESAHIEELTVLPTKGGWRSIEREWLESERIEQSPSKELPAEGARLIPSPLLLCDEPVTASVEARYIHPRATDGVVTLTSPEGFAVEPEVLEFTEISSVANPTQRITVTTSAQRRAGELGLEMHHPGVQGRFTAPLITLGSSRGPVRVDEATDQGETVWHVNNGWLSFGVRPGVLGILYTLSTPEGERLYTNFPEPRARWWDYPVYGGIRPIVWERGGWSYDDLGRLAGQVLGSVPTVREGVQGMRWEGVRLSADLEHEKLLGLRFDIEYLTLPNSNVLTVLSTLLSTGPTRAVTLKLHVSPATEPEGPLLVLPDQTAYARGGMRGGASARGNRWVSVEYPSTGHNTVLVGTFSGTVEGQDMGPYGVTCATTLDAVVSVGRAVQMRNYLVLACDRQQVPLYAALSELDSL